VIVPISISSSDDRLPGHSRTIWAIAVAVGATLVLALEFLWRSMGYEPSITDDMDLWAQQRERASGRLAVALVGGSRMAVDFVPGIFEKRNPEHTVANIAIDGHRPMATLMALADDENFSGLVIVSLLALDVGPKYRNHQEDYNRYYEDEWGLLDEMTRRVNTGIQSTVVFPLPELHPHRVFLQLMKGGAMLPQWLLRYPNRFKKAHYELRSDLADVLEERVRSTRWDHRDEPMSTADWQSGLELLARMVAKIRDRGGEVVLVRFPSSGQVLEIEEAAYPPSRYWSEIGPKTAAITLHFRDLPGAGDFDCPDGSHLDYARAVRFTQTLVEILASKGLPL
jgi:hypothetical protein